MSFDRLPTEIKEQIILAVGNMDFSNIQRCLLVCKTWKDIIIWCLKNNPNKNWGRLTMIMIRKSWKLNLPLGS